MTDQNGWRTPWCFQGYAESLDYGSSGVDVIVGAWIVFMFLACPSS